MLKRYQISMSLASLLFLFTPHCVLAEEIQFFGDVLLSRGISQLVAHEGQDRVWKDVSPLFKRDAINIVNLEGAVGDVASCAPNHNPCFAISVDNLPLLAPFEIVSLANNHSLDLGLTGLKKTVQEIRKSGATPLSDEKYSTTFRTRQGDVGLVVLTDMVNAKGDREQFILPDSLKAIEAISNLKRKTSYVAVYIHWGKELDTLPTVRMRSLARQFVRAGADIVVGHHPHVLGTVECIDEKPVVYSLGNFLFDQKYGETKQGAVMRCVIRQDKLSCQLIGTETPMNSFAPKIAKKADFVNQANQVLESCKPTIIQTWSDKFTRNSGESRAVLRRSKDKATMSQIKLYDMDKEKAQLTSPQMPIVSLQPVDVNLDGLQELMIIQNIYSTIDEEVAKRVYVYGLDDGMKAIWRGSALSRPLLDALFLSPSKNQAPILIALHSTDSFLIRNKTKPGKIIMSYRWNGFGFTGIKEIKLNISADYLSYSKGVIKVVGSDGSITSTLSVFDLF